MTLDEQSATRLCVHDLHACGPRYSLIDSMPYDRRRRPCGGSRRARGAAKSIVGLPIGGFIRRPTAAPQCGPQAVAERTLTGECRPQERTPCRRPSRRATVGPHSGHPRRWGLSTYRRCHVGHRRATNCAAARDDSANRWPSWWPISPRPNDCAIDPTETTSTREPRESDRRAAAAKTRRRWPPDVTEGLNTIGLMLPDHAVARSSLPVRFGRPLVVTSGNLEGDPLAFESDAAQRDLASIADAWLDHDRPIVRPIDDSVVRVIAGQVGDRAHWPAAWRRCRLDLQTRCPCWHWAAIRKRRSPLSNGAQAVLGPHVGDLETEAARARYLDHVEALCQLYGAQPELLVHDEHPDYFTTRWAAEQNIPAMAVQHHHAHVAAGMLEHGWLDREVLGSRLGWNRLRPRWHDLGRRVSCWPPPRDFRRVAQLATLCACPAANRPCASRGAWRCRWCTRRPAAKQAAKLAFRGRRSLARSSRLSQLLGKPRLLARDVQRRPAVRRRRRAGSWTSRTSQFEGQPAMLLEAACDPTCGGEYALPFLHRASQHARLATAHSRRARRSAQRTFARARSPCGFIAPGQLALPPSAEAIPESAGRAVRRVLSEPGADRAGCRATGTTRPIAGARRGSFPPATAGWRPANWPSRRHDIAGGWQPCA